MIHRLMEIPTNILASYLRTTKLVAPTLSITSKKVRKFSHDSRRKQKCQQIYVKQQTGNNLPGAEPVDAYPSGASPYGVMDLVGNTYEYTDEFQDDHTRFVILRGGSNYRPSGSTWYFPQSLELNTYEKYFLMDDRYERAGTLGFRCARLL